MIHESGDGCGFKKRRTQVKKIQWNFQWKPPLEPYPNSVLIYSQFSCVIYTQFLKFWLDVQGVFYKFKRKGSSEPMMRFNGREKGFTNSVQGSLLVVSKSARYQIIMPLLCLYFSRFFTTFLPSRDYMYPLSTLSGHCILWYSLWHAI